MESIIKHLTNKVSDAFEKCGYERRLGQVSISDRFEFTVENPVLWVEREKKTEQGVQECLASSFPGCPRGNSQVPSHVLLGTKLPWHCYSRLDLGLRMEGTQGSSKRAA